MGKRVSVLAGIVSAGIAMFFASSDKGLFELATRPFYWDKTTHGLFDPVEEAADRPAA